MLRQVAARIAAMDPGTYDSEVAPEWVCFFCHLRQRYDGDGYVERHDAGCDLVLLRQAIEEERDES